MTSLIRHVTVPRDDVMRSAGAGSGDVTEWVNMAARAAGLWSERMRRVERMKTPLHTVSDRSSITSRSS